MGERKKDSESDEIWVYEFTEESAHEFREELLRKSGRNHETPIVIYIDSYGGYVDSLAKMIETMDEVPNPKITVCMGKAMSCGAILLSHGDIRFCGRHSRIMVHETSSGTVGDVHDTHADTIESKRLNRHFMGLLAKNCSLGGYEALRKIIKQRDGRNIYMCAVEAIKFGIADHVGTPDLKTITLYNMTHHKPHNRYKLHKPKRKAKSKAKKTRKRPKK